MRIAQLLNIYVFLTLVCAHSDYLSPDGLFVSLSVVTSGEDHDVLATIEAPNSAKWFAIGFGNQMANSLMFVAWPYNDTIILSTRLAPGEGLPPVYSGPEVQLLSSKISNNSTVVSFQCSNCTSWSMGELDVQSTSADLIYAYGETAPMNPSNPNSDFLIHTYSGNFNLNLKAAQITSTNSTTSLNSTTVPPLTSLPSGLTSRQKVILIHGLAMGIIWLLLLPLGAIIINFLKQRLSNAVQKHRYLQLISLILLFTAAGAGFYLATGHHFLYSHGIFGVIILSMIVVQAGFGWYHHRRYVCDKPIYRRWFTYVHIWLGRTTIICGMVNCGLGIVVATEEVKWGVIWWSCCGVLVAIYFGVCIYFWKGARKLDTKESNAVNF